MINRVVINNNAKASIITILIMVAGFMHYCGAQNESGLVNEPIMLQRWPMDYASVKSMQPYNPEQTNGTRYFEALYIYSGTDGLHFGTFYYEVVGALPTRKEIQCKIITEYKLAVDCTTERFAFILSEFANKEEWLKLNQHL